MVEDATVRRDDEHPALLGRVALGLALAESHGAASRSSAAAAPSLSSVSAPRLSWAALYTLSDGSV